MVGGRDEHATDAMVFFCTLSLGTSNVTHFQKFNSSILSAKEPKKVFLVWLVYLDLKEQDKSNTFSQHLRKNVFNQQ